MRKTFCTLFFAFLFLLCAAGANAEFYEWVDEDGNVHITNTPVDRGKDNRKIKSLSGEKAPKSAKKSDQSSDEWFGCGERYYRAGVEASEYLEEQEGWDTKPIFDPYYRQFGNGNQLTYHFSAKLPQQEVSAMGCSSGLLTVKVKTEEDMTTRKCRILGVELGERRYEPARCRK